MSEQALSTYQGSCHCGAVQFEIDTDHSAARCNCSLCTRRNATMVSAVDARLRITKGAENLSSYQFNTHIAEHFFCKTCGIYTHHRPRSNPAIFRANAGCLEGLDQDKLTITPVDGASFS